MIPIPFEPMEWARQEAVMITVRDNVPAYMAIPVVWAPDAWPELMRGTWPPSTGLRGFLVHERAGWMRLAS